MRESLWVAVSNRTYDEIIVDSLESEILAVTEAEKRRIHVESNFAFKGELDYVKACCFNSFNHAYLFWLILSDKHNQTGSDSRKHYQGCG